MSTTIQKGDRVRHTSRPWRKGVSGRVGTVLSADNATALVKWDSLGVVLDEEILMSGAAVADLIKVKE